MADTIKPITPVKPVLGPSTPQAKPAAAPGAPGADDKDTQQLAQPKPGEKLFAIATDKDPSGLTHIYARDPAHAQQVFKQTGGAGTFKSATLTQEDITKMVTMLEENGLEEGVDYYVSDTIRTDEAQLAEDIADIINQEWWEAGSAKAQQQDKEYCIQLSNEDAASANNAVSKIKKSLNICKEILSSGAATSEQKAQLKDIMKRIQSQLENISNATNKDNAMENNNTPEVNESDMSGILDAAKNYNKSFIITAKTAEGQTKKYRVKAQSMRVAKEKFSQHHNQATVLDIIEEMGENVTEDSRADMVGFSLETERAYQAVMSRYGDMIDHDEDSGIMYAPERLWSKIEMIAFDADGIGAMRDDDDRENPEHYGINEDEMQVGIEAYGVMGMKSKPWRKTFKSQEAFEKWMERAEGDYELHGTREVELPSTKKYAPMREGYRVVPGIDTERYQERSGLEGPFHTKSGKVVYYDKKEGSYYDPDTDMYISYDDWRALNEDMDDEDMDDDEGSSNQFYVALYDEDENTTFVGIVYNDGKWREEAVAGSAPYKWGGTYMGYLSPNEVMQWIKKDYDRGYEVAGPFSTEQEAMAYAEHNFGPMESVSESKHGLNKRVRIVNGPADAIGKIGTVGEVRHGVHATAPKTYTVDYTDAAGNTTSIQLQAKDLRLVKESATELKMKTKKVKEATKEIPGGRVHTAEPGGYGRNDDDEELTAADRKRIAAKKKAEKAAQPKRGRGRPKAEPKVDTSTAAKSLQSWIVGNVPKNSKSLAKLPATKHKMSDTDVEESAKAMGKKQTVKESMAQVQSLKKQIAETMKKVQSLPMSQQNDPRVAALVSKLEESVGVVVKKLLKEDRQDDMAGLQRTIDFAQAHGYKVSRSTAGKSMKFHNKWLDHTIVARVSNEGDAIIVNFEDYSSGVSGNDSAEYFDQTFKNAYQDAKEREDWAPKGETFSENRQAVAEEVTAQKSKDVAENLNDSIEADISRLVNLSGLKK